MKGWAIAIIIIIVIAAFGVLLYVKGGPSAPAPTGSASTPAATTTPAEGTSTATSSLPAASDVVVTAPKANELVKSPVAIVGKARGTWFFEANLPVRLIDANGKELGRIGAHAQGDWMTTDYVPFAASLSFAAPTTSTGTLIIMRDNPSGLPQNDAQFMIPVRFK